jgi:hypothetical protein
MTTTRQILTPIGEELNRYLLIQQQTHGLQHRRVLSLASICRATLAGCARANFAFGELENTDRITEVIADALSHYFAGAPQAADLERSGSR